MATISFEKDKEKDIYLCSTSVENFVINEFIPVAPAGAIKLYLLGLMYAEQEMPMDTEKLSRVLRMTPDEIDEAWDYWVSLGVVRKNYDLEGSGNYRIVFISQIERFFGKKKASAAKSPSKAAGASNASGAASGTSEEQLIDRELRGLYDHYEAVAGRTISMKEMKMIADAVKQFLVSPDVFDYAIKYCAEKEKTGIEYIATVARNWKKEGCSDIVQVRELLDRNSRRRELYQRVFRELGFRRARTPGDEEMMDRWLDEYGFTENEVIEACRKTAGKRDPSLNYVNAILENQILEKGGIKLPKAYGGSPASGNRKGRGGQGGESKPDLSDPRQRISRDVLERYYRWLRDESVKNLEKHRTEIEERIPAMKYIRDKEEEARRLLITFGNSEEGRAKRQETRELLHQLAQERRNLLRSNGYPEDYLDLKHKCNECRDTGVLEDGRFCSCQTARSEEAYEWYQKRQEKK